LIETIYNGQLEKETSLMNRRDELALMLDITNYMDPYRYEDMLAYMFELTRMDIECTTHECSLLSTAYANIKNRSFSSTFWISDKTTQFYTQKLELVEQYKTKILNEYEDVVIELIQVTNDHLLPSCTNELATIPILLNKANMQSDMCDRHPEYKIQAKETYETALRLVKKHYQPIDKLRLDVVHKLSTFYFEKMKAVGMAQSLASPEFYRALENLDTVMDGDYSGVTTTMQFMRDNIVHWQNVLRFQDATSFH
jgi:hypothetical protein